MSEVRLQLWLAKSGVASRRRAEAMIEAGEVEVNGQAVTKLGSKVDPVRDRVTVRGRPVAAEAPAYLLLNKPKGYVTTASDPDGRPTIFDLVPPQGVRLYPVGRLDYNTEGALLLTNDGELAHALMHPSRGVRKVYHAKFQGEVSREQIRQLENGVDLPPPVGWHDEHPGERYKSERSAPADVSLVSETGKHTWLELAIHEGKNRQIHRMAAGVGSSVRKLVRVAYGSLTIEGLEPGAHRALTDAEVVALRQLAGLSKRPTSVGPTQPRPAGSRRGRDEEEPAEDEEAPRPARRAREDGPPRRASGPRDAAPPPRRAAGPRDAAQPTRRAAGLRDAAPPPRRARDDGPPRRSSGPRDAAPPPRRAREDGPPRRSSGPRDAAPPPRRAREDGPPRRAAGLRDDAPPARRARDDGPPRRSSGPRDAAPPLHRARDAAPSPPRSRAAQPRRPAGPRDDAPPSPRTREEGRRPSGPAPKDRTARPASRPPRRR